MKYNLTIEGDEFGYKMKVKIDDKIVYELEMEKTNNGAKAVKEIPKTSDIEDNQLFELIEDINVGYSMMQYADDQS